MTKGDPFYDRKPVPNEFIEHVGPSGLSEAQAENIRERKFSLKEGGDLRHFSNPKSGGKVDPFYQRKPVPDSLIHGVGETGLSHEQEYANRERKYSVNGGDIRKFSDNSAKAGWHPTDDPYYGRKSVKKPQIEGVGETGMTPAEAFEARENKESLVDLSSDPFAQITGRGHRASVSAAAAPVEAAARRRSSAVAPDVHHSEHHPHHSGYEGNTLQTITSRVDGDEIRPSTEGSSSGHGAYPTTAFTSTGPTSTGPTTTTTTTTTRSGGLNPATSTSINPVTSSLDPAADVKVRDQSGHHVGTTGHTAFYDQATKDLDNIGPHDRV